jgi:hypothetical protein
MDRRTFVKTVPALAMMAGVSAAFAEELQPIVLPKPEKDGGKSVLATRCRWTQGSWDAIGRSRRSRCSRQVVRTRCHSFRSS